MLGEQIVAVFKGAVNEAVLPVKPIAIIAGKVVGFRAVLVKVSSFNVPSEHEAHFIDRPN